MEYISTRGGSERLKSAEAIIKGLSLNGGLFVPETIPVVDQTFLEGLVGISYEARAKKILTCFLTDYTADEVEGCIRRAYGEGKFDDERCAPTKMFDEQDAFNVLELWHGPTSAFKDMALQLLPQLMSTAMKKTVEKDEILILVATSGDTGKAALEGFRDVDGIKIMVFYPEGGVSRIQHLQMCTQSGNNVMVMAVRGNFDDAQTGVKKIFNDDEFSQKLQRMHVKLSSANSINWGRLVPQIVYYFSSYADLVSAHRISMGDTVNFCVPTGNFGDILAGWYAKQMGLPVGRLVCASNKNDVLTDFLRTGIYNRKRPFYKTITPSMDILISSNLERLLYHLSGDAEQIASWMKQLREDGCYQIRSGLLEKIKETFWADRVEDAVTKETIHEVYQRHHYVIDTHTAVAWHVAEAYQRETGDKRPMVVVSTASPYKFNGSVLEALGIETEGLDEFEMLERLQEIQTNPIPQGLAVLKAKPVRFKESCCKEEMESCVMTFAAQGKKR